MSGISRNIAIALSCGAIVAIFAMPAYAAGGLGVGVGASVGGSGGVNAGVGASVGGSGGVNAGLGASVGGSGGVNAGATASVGGSNGVNAGVGANVGLGLGIGGDTSDPGNPSNLSKPGNLTKLGLSGAVASMSGNQLARMKKRCVDVLSSEGSYDSDLRALCLMIARR